MRKSVKFPIKYKIKHICRFGKICFQSFDCKEEYTLFASQIYCQSGLFNCFSPKEQAYIETLAEQI